jgi:hypothetical protein
MKLTPRKSGILLSLLCLALAASWMVFAPGALAAETPKDTQTALNELRLKRLTKELSLTADQQKKIQVLFDEEAKEAAKVNADSALSVNDRRQKISDVQDVTYGKIKPLLEPAQLEAFEKFLAKVRPKKN